MIESGMQFSGAFRPLEHRQRDAVLDAAAGVEELRLGVDVLALQTDERRVADQVKHGMVRQSNLRDRWIGAGAADCINNRQRNRNTALTRPPPKCTPPIPSEGIKTLPL